LSKLQHAFDSPDAKRRYVRSLFATIADRYDFITVVLSYGRDRAWKRRLVREAHVRRGERAIDLACGTGDIAFQAAGRGAIVTGLDITARMVEIARAKGIQAKAAGEWPIPRFLVGDMGALPFASGSVDLVTTGYGLRNVPDLAGAIDEIARVLRPDGRLLSLDFNRPQWPPVRRAYLAYLTCVGSTLGWLLHRDPETYRYIPESVRRYPGAQGVAQILQQRGFDRVKIVPLLGGLMTLHVAHRRAARS
jgi:demethylmenaquinone methyltransferase/2-methoxy-6-polyprenyl-1,4-benzoquinol methylase